MRRMPKSKKDKVPKITEEEYAKYISSLRNEPNKERGQGLPAVTRQGESKSEV